MKKLSILIIAITVFFSFGITARAYDDIPADSPYFYAIEYLRRNDVFMNTKEFKPDIIINKAEFIKYLVLLNSPEFTTGGKVKLPFEDTQDNAWYAPYFQEAVRLGILSDRDTKVEPYEKLTVIDAVELLFHSQSIPIPKVYKGSIPYKDVARNTRVAPMIMRALKFDLITPSKADYVGIYKRVTRAEAARMIYKMDLVNLIDPAEESANAIQSLDIELQKVISSWDFITTNFVRPQEVDKTSLSDSAIKGMMETLDDPYSEYFDQESNSFFSDDLDGEIEGIGAFVDVNEEEEIIIVAPIAGSPAEKAGIKAGDVILKVDDTEVTGMNLLKAVNLIKGPRGTTVKLTVRRDTGNTVIEVTRDVISIKSLTYEVIENGKIMLVHLSQFNQNGPAEFQEAMEIIENNPDIKGLIIDVRDNPGGLLEAVIGILNFLLESESEIVTIKQSFFEYTRYSNGSGNLTDLPKVVLVNNGSASASEILAGALQDHDLATIIGETTFGKGTVQELYPFYDNSSLKLTIAEWLTPLGKNIHKNGITPDIEIADNPNTNTDEQMDRAIQEVNRLILKK